MYIVISQTFILFISHDAQIGSQQSATSTRVKLNRRPVVDQQPELPVTKKRKWASPSSSQGLNISGGSGGSSSLPEKPADTKWVYF